MTDDGHDDAHERAVDAIAKVGISEIVEAVIGELPLVRPLKELVAMLIPTGSANFEEAMQREIADAVLTRMPEIERRVKTLEGEGRISGTTNRIYIVLLADAWNRAADAKTREQAVDAFVGAFDPARYDQARTQRLLEMRARLDYADVECLRRHYKGRRFEVRVDSDELLHCTRLAEVGVLTRTVATQSEHAFMPTPWADLLIALIDSGATPSV